MNPFSVAGGGKDYESLENDEIIMKHDGRFSRGTWEWDLESKLKQLQLIKNDTLLDVEYLLISTGKISSCIDACVVSKSYLGSYNIDAQIFKTTDNFTKYPPIIRIKLHQVSESVYFLLSDSEIPPHLYSIISIDIFKVINPKKTIVLDLATDEFQRGPKAYTNIATSKFLENQPLKNVNGLVAGFSANILTLVPTSYFRLK
jgi:hypothetical protein